METREQILSAATDAFAQQGYHQTSMDQIAKAAGLSKGAVYYFFENKAALFLAVVQDGLRYLDEQGEALRTSYYPIQQSLRRFVAAYVSACRNYPKIAALLFTGRVEQLEPELNDALKTLMQKQVARLCDLLQEGISAGILRPIKPQWVISAFAGMLANLCCDQTLPIDQTPTQEEATEVLCTLLLDGLVRRWG